jgi:hypothetical protein
LSDRSTNVEALGWPTTMRFSRQLGETMRGADYAQSIEAPTDCAPAQGWLVVIALVISLLGVSALVAWPGS